MEILIIQANGEHDKNRNFRECFGLQRAFQKLGHNTFVSGRGHAFNDQGRYNDYDLIFLLEQYETNWLPDLNSTTRPVKMFWSTDGHAHRFTQYKHHRDIFHKNGYDILLQCMKRWTEHVYERWLPGATHEDLLVPLEGIKKEHDIGFCGNWVNRQNIYNILNDAFGVKLDIGVIGQDMVRAINSYKIHMNRNHSFGMNGRNFETIACGTALLTNWSEEHDDLGFVDGENCIVYYDEHASIIPEGLPEKVQKYLDDPDLLEEIARNGRELSKKHTYTERAKQILLYYDSFKNERNLWVD
tara:strand:+ start:928 stop:1824 length:897 start_codon:yes stop_codon:yes gene_type:complete